MLFVWLVRPICLRHLTRFYITSFGFLFDTNLRLKTFLTISLRYLAPALYTYVIFAAFALPSTSKLPPLLPLLWFTHFFLFNSTTESVTHYTSVSQIVKYSVSNALRILLLVLLSPLLNSLTAVLYLTLSSLLRSLHWLKIREQIHYTVTALTLKPFQTSQPSYLRSLLTIQPHRSTRCSSCLTFLRPPPLPCTFIYLFIYKIVHKGHKKTIQDVLKNNKSTTRSFRVSATQ